MAPDELRHLMRAVHVTGLTSNPTIFRAAMLGTDRYRTRLAAFAGFSPQVAYDSLAIEEVRAAADTHAPVFARTDGADGLVSLEVAPALDHHDADGTVAAALDLWQRIDRPNAMITIPATPAGVEATRRATAAVVNVNVTLLFSVERYGAVADAYLSGLEDRIRGGAPVDRIASVASFFVSRVDTTVDALVGAAGRSDLARRAAVAGARLAFARAGELCGGPRFAVPRAAGARSQRLLWASTGTKDAAYSDVKYVDELAGPGVVNTMPPATLSAYADHDTLLEQVLGHRVEVDAGRGDAVERVAGGALGSGQPVRGRARRLHRFDARSARRIRRAPDQPRLRYCRTARTRR